MFDRARSFRSAVITPSASPRPQPSSTRHPKEVRHVVSEASRHAPCAAVGAAAGPGSELGRRLRLGRRRLDAAAPLPRPRLGGRLLLRVRVGADPRERAGGRASAVREDGPRAVARDRRACRPRAARRRTIRPCSRSRSRRVSATPRRGGPRSRRCRGWRARARTCSSSRCSSRASAAGAARSVARSAAGTPTQPVDALAYQAVKYRQRDGRDAPRPAPSGAPGAPVGAGNPDARRLGRARVACSSGSSAAARPTACRVWSRASSAPRRRRPPRETAALVREYRLPREALQPGAPDLAGGLGGAARRHADDGADPQPGDDDARRRARAGLGRHGDGRRAARRRRAHPQGARAPDRRARGAPHLRVRPRCSRPRRVEPGARDRRRPRRRVLHGVRQRRAGGQAAAARARRVGLDDVRRRRRRPGPDAAGRVGGARARDGGDRVAVRGRRLLRGQAAVSSKRGRRVVVAATPTA